ncbi:hypothetical protein BDR04DRAFT_1147459 [Suillus decipiens]|nr:hypothetical protein BDR04DRAFT_1147459 [Suillus decipiens]
MSRSLCVTYAPSAVFCSGRLDPSSDIFQTSGRRLTKRLTDNRWQTYHNQTKLTYHTCLPGVAPKSHRHLHVEMTLDQIRVWNLDGLAQTPGPLPQPAPGMAVIRVALTNCFEFIRPETDSRSYTLTNSNILDCGDGLSVNALDEEILRDF